MSEAVSKVSFANEGLMKWQIAHAMTTRLKNGEMFVSDEPVYNWHLLRIFDNAFVYRLVRIRILLRPLPSSTAHFYVHHFGAIDVAEVTLAGAVANRGISRSLALTQHEQGVLEVDVEYLSLHPTISVGTSKSGNPIYVGAGSEQFSILRIDIETRDATSELSRIPLDERLQLIDVGGQEGLQLKWMLKADRITPIVFEPIASEAALLRDTIPRIPGGQVIETALAHTNGNRKLHITAASGCSSLLSPNFEVLNRYSIGRIFRVVEERDVACKRYDELYRNMSVPPPDAIKIDVQGFEYEVLLGFGHLLESCLGIELETHFYPVYRGQQLTGDIVSLLDEFGLVLRKLEQADNFDGDSVEFNAFFTKRREAVINLSEPARKKMSLLTEVWGLRPYI